MVDCDEKPTASGWDEWIEIASRYDPELSWLSTLLVRTGGGGTHLYYRWPAGVQASQSGLAPHVDIRSNGGVCGGYVLAAGSVTTKGSYRVEEDTAIADAPPWLVELCRERPRPPRLDSGYTQPAVLSFAGLQTLVATAVEHNRNQALLYAARCMCTDGADIDTAIATLAPHYTAGPEREAIDTIRSAYRLQSLKG